jgi:hypothetical protein
MNCDFPIHLKILRLFFVVFSNRSFAILCSLAFLVTGYCWDSYNGLPMYFSGCAGMMTVFGLVLTIKHNYLMNIGSVTSLISAEYEESQCGPPSIDLARDRQYMNTLFSKATDEGIGLVLIVLGAVLSAFGSVIPLSRFFLPT